MSNPMTTADAIVCDWHSKLPSPLSPIDLSALRAYVAQAIVREVADKDEEIKQLRERLAAVSTTAKQVLGSDRNA